jgi:hypothetical protein
MTNNNAPRPLETIDLAHVRGGKREGAGPTDGLRLDGDRWRPPPPVLF